MVDVWRQVRTACPAADTVPVAGGGETMKKFLVSLVRDDEGQDLVEYAMLVALIALVAAVGVRAFGTALSSWFSDLAGSVPLT
jgi:pilus assembly protein Flp/PilA